MTDDLNEADLHAWVDDRLDPARRPLVERHLAENPALRQRLEDWSSQARALRAALHGDDEANRLALMQRLARPRPLAGLRPHWAAAAALLLALGLGGAGGWAARGDPKPSEISRLGVEAVSAYRILGADTAAAVPVSASNRGEVRTMLAQKLGRRIPLPDLSSMGYHLASGRVLPAIYGPAAMLVYDDADGNRITIYLQPMQVGAPAGMRPIQTEALNGYAWIDQKIGYTVMSEDARDRVQAAADHVRAESRL